MATKDKNQKAVERNMNKTVTNFLSNITNLGKKTNTATYGLTSDLYDTDRLLEKINTLQQSDKTAVESTVKGTLYTSTRINTFGLTSSDIRQQVSDKPKNDIKSDIYRSKQDMSIFDTIASNKDIFQELKQYILMNNHLYDTVQDYEIMRRAIPEVSRVIDLLINSVITPEAITSEIFNMKYDLKSDANRTMAEKIKEKYDLDNKLRTIVENYFIIGVEYITVVPYRAVIEAIKQDGLDNHANRKHILKESTLLTPESTSRKLLTEATATELFGTKLEEILTYDNTKGYINQDAANIMQTKIVDNIVESYLSKIKVYKSNKALSYNSALVESVMGSDNESDFLLESATYNKEQEMYKKSFDLMESANDAKSFNAKVGEVDGHDGLGPTKRPKTSSIIANNITMSSEQAKEYDNMHIRGCKIERLDPSRIWPLRVKDTVVAYVYIEERRDDYMRLNLRNQLSQQFSFYKVNANEYGENTLRNIENRIIQTIGSSVLENISPKFVESNFDQMDIFYDFLRDRQIHKESRDIILLHPDDVIEFKRSKGSLLRNAIFFLKMYLLMVITNILTKVRRGSDRTLYYIDNGLSNDIEGAVMDAIAAIQQSQVRFSDFGTISGIIGAVGSVVDLFIPQASDGQAPIKPEVVPGQQVDMDEDFLKYLIKSIILSFNVPSVVVDYTNEVEFAKTLSMANLDVATSSAHAQAELNAPLTRLIRRVMAYELDLTMDEVESIEATLIPSRSMLMQITNELIQTVQSLGQTMAELNIMDDDGLMKKLFIKAFVRENLVYEWDGIDDLINKVKMEQIKVNLDKKAKDASAAGDTTTGFDSTSSSDTGNSNTDSGSYDGGDDLNV